MVYNNVVYKPATLGERLQARFGERAAKAVNGGSKNINNEGGQEATVLSFFGRMGDERSANRAIPTRRRVVKTEPRAAAPAANRARSAQNDPSARRADVNASVRNRVNTQRAQSGRSAYASPNITGTFARAYAAGEGIRTATANYAPPRRRYAEGAVPSGALRRGRSNIPGSRHAVLVTDDSGAEKRSFVNVVKSAFSDRRVAEHRVKRSPFPLGFVTIIGVFALMVMILVFSFSQIHEYNSSINDQKATLSELEAEAAKLEVQLAECEDLRDIERIAVEDIGMVSSDVVQSKFVSVSTPDRVEVLRVETEEEEGGFSSLLSAIGESFGRIGEYFN